MFDPTRILPHFSLSLPTLAAAGGGKVGLFEPELQEWFEASFDFGRMGFEEKSATGCPLPKRETGKRTV